MRMTSRRINVRRARLPRNTPLEAAHHARSQISAASLAEAHSIAFSQLNSAPHAVLFTCVAFSHQARFGQRRHTRGSDQPPSAAGGESRAVPSLGTGTKKAGGTSCASLDSCVWHFEPGAVSPEMPHLRPGPNQPRRGGPASGSGRANARQPVQADAGSADGWTADEADGATRGRRASTQKAPGGQCCCGNNRWVSQSVCPSVCPSVSPLESSPIPLPRD
jgi:hypothetical protein